MFAKCFPNSLVLRNWIMLYFSNGLAPYTPILDVNVFHMFSSKGKAGPQRPPQRWLPTRVAVAGSVGYLPGIAAHFPISSISCTFSPFTGCMAGLPKQDLCLNRPVFIFPILTPIASAVLLSLTWACLGRKGRLCFSGIERRNCHISVYRAISLLPRLKVWLLSYWGQKHDQAPGNCAISVYKRNTRHIRNSHPDGSLRHKI